MEVKQGDRNLQTFLDPNIKINIPSKFFAEPGHIISTPCYTGHDGYNCEKCPLGTYKINPFSTGCKECNSEAQSGSYKIYENYNDCSNFICDTNLVSIDKSLNKDCLVTEVFMIELYKNIFLPLLCVEMI